jgi:hypothetical protein
MQMVSADSKEQIKMTTKTFVDNIRNNELKFLIIRCD